MKFPEKRAIVRTVVAWLAAVLLVTLLGCVMQTQFNLSALSALGADISWATRLQTTGQDVLGFSPSFGPLVAIGLLIAFPVTRALRIWAPGPAMAWYGLAGGVAVLTILLALNAAFGITPVAAARSLAGLLSLALCGAVGGTLFARLLPQPTPEAT